jgi:hypothetical protein
MFVGDVDSTILRYSRRAFQENPLTFFRNKGLKSGYWLHLHQCLWGPSEIRDRYSLKHSLHKYEKLFKKTLQIGDATTSMLIDELDDITQNAPDAVDPVVTQYAAKILLELSRKLGFKKTADDDLGRLNEMCCWPCRLSHGERAFMRVDAFYVNDQQDLYEDFKDNVAFLDVHFAEAKVIARLLDRLGCKASLNAGVESQTEAQQPQQYEEDLTSKYRSYADALVEYEHKNAYFRCY